MKCEGKLSTGFTNTLEISHKRKKTQKSEESHIILLGIQSRESDLYHKSFRRFMPESSDKKKI